VRSDFGQLDVDPARDRCGAIVAAGRRAARQREPERGQGEYGKSGPGLHLRTPLRNARDFGSALEVPISFPACGSS
jgi:hypothetical protein